MTATTTTDERGTRAGAPLLVGAAMAAATAGLVHAAAAGSHDGQRTLMWLFALAAAVQLGWAALAVSRPGRAAAAIGVVLNGAFVAAWAVSRMRGLPVIDALSDREPVGTQDAVAAVAGALAVLLAGAHLAGARLPAALRAAPAGAIAGLAFLALAVPGMAAEHTHGPSHDHDHGHGESAEHDAVDAEVAAHGDGDVDVDVDVDGDDHGHDAGPIISLQDPRVTDEQRAAAQALIDDTVAGMARFTDVASVEAAGYVSIGDGVTGWEHFVHPGHLTSPTEMDPDAIESIVFKVYPDGTRQLASAMYILPFGRTMADVPDIAGELTTWHDHQDLCWEGIRVVGRTDANGDCARGVFRPTPPMLHVWLLPHECGPFAGIEGTHGESCDHDHGDVGSSGETAARDR
jgi:hypothetical protein